MRAINPGRSPSIAIELRQSNPVEKYRALAVLKERANSVPLSPNAHVPSAFAGGRRPFRLGDDGSRKNGDTYRHTTHQLGPIRIAYRFHPFFDHEVRVIRGLRAREEPAVIVEIDEDLRIAVPCWMLDALCCRSMVIEEQPRISIDALVQLRDLIDRQALLAGEKDNAHGSMVAKENRHEPRNRSQTSGADSAPTET